MEYTQRKIELEAVKNYILSSFVIKWEDLNQLGNAEFYINSRLSYVNNMSYYGITFDGVELYYSQIGDEFGIKFGDYLQYETWNADEWFRDLRYELKRHAAYQNKVNDIMEQLGEEFNTEVANSEIL